MIKIASFVKRPLTEIETQHIIEAIGSNELEIVPFKCKRKYCQSMATSLFYSTPVNCDVVLLKTRPYSIPLSLSQCLFQTVINIRMSLNKYNHPDHNKFIGLDVYKQGELLKSISFSKYDTKPIRKNFVRLKQLRKSFKLSQEEVSKYLHIAQSSYAGIEQGRALITTDHLITLALMYNVTTDYILGLSNNPDPI